MNQELDRIRAEYGRRQRDPRLHQIYSRYSRADIFILQERERALLELLGAYEGPKLSGERILDVGAGHGHLLGRFISYGADTKNLFGLDLMRERILTAKDKYANLNWICGDGAQLPIRDQSFDLILQFVVFSSVLDSRMRKQIAKEMLRVLKPTGSILWYDFCFNPINPRTHGIERGEIVDLFPGCAFDFRRATLAPPLVRAIAPYSLLIATALSRIPFLRTHLMAWIKPLTG